MLKFTKSCTGCQHVSYCDNIAPWWNCKSIMNRSARSTKPPKPIISRFEPSPKPPPPPPPPKRRINKMDVNEITVKIKADTTQFEEALERAKDAMEGFDQLNLISVIPKDVGTLVFKATGMYREVDLQNMSDILSQRIGVKCVVINHSMDVVMGMED